MAFVASNVSNEPRSYSLGPQKLQVMKYTAASGDTSGTITADGLSSIDSIIMDGLQQTTAVSISGNVATVTFQDPVATVSGGILVLGK